MTGYIGPKKSAKIKKLMKISKEEIAYLKRCKESSAEAKLNWLADALEFAKAKKHIVKNR